MSPIDGQKVRALREARALSQRALAAVADLRQPTLSAIETGTARRVTIEMLEALAGALGVDSADLLTRQSGRGKRASRTP